MPFPVLLPPADFSPRRWVLPHSGTNGYISSWGDMQAGVCPNLPAV